MNWLRKFMAGRYGVDNFSNVLITISLILLVSNIFIKAQLLYILGLAVLFYSYFRVFSRNTHKRYQENMQFLNATKPIREKTNRFKRRIKSLKTHKYYKCPECNKKLRVPKGKGKINIKCPNCKHKFTRRT